MKVVVIANPIAGRGKLRNRLRAFLAELHRRGHRAEVCLTRGPGDASHWAAQVASDADRLVVAGGDGTINEVLNGLVDPASTPLLPLALGTANMLAREIRAPRSARDLVQALEQETVLRADMGLLGERRFLLLASAGFDALVTKELRECRGARLGFRGYAAPILNAARRFSPSRLRITVDDQDPVTGSTGMILNSRNYGGLFEFDREAGLSTGSFRVCVFRRGTIPALLRYAAMGLLRTAGRAPDVIHLTGTRVRIVSDVPCSVQVDGDYLRETPVEVRLVASVVPLVAGASIGIR